MIARLILVLLFPWQVVGGAVVTYVAPAPTYAHYRLITIDHTKVGASDSTNFPVLVSGTYTYLKTVGNGGEVQNANGYDIGFFTDTGCSTKLAWETETWGASTGTVNYWVNIPTLSHTGDTLIYLCYDSTSVTTDQSNATGTWNSAFKVVYHFKDGTTLSGSDSTSNANTATLNSSPTAVVGQVDGAMGTNGTSQYANTGSNVLNPSTTDFSAAIWAYATSNASNQALSQQNGTGTGRLWIGLGNSGGGGGCPSPNACFNESIGNIQTAGTTNISTSTWYRVYVTKTGTTVKLYVNGALEATATATAESSDGKMNIGTGKTASGSWWPGRIDEFSLSNTLRSADWITADYNSQNSPSTFYTVGSEN